MPDPALSPLEITDMAKEAARRRTNQLRGIVDEGLEANPDKAATANDIAKGTNSDGKFILKNIDEAEREHRRGLAGNIVENDPELRRYIKSDPLAASVSNDDWGNLAKYSKAVTGMYGDWQPEQATGWWDTTWRTYMGSQAQKAKGWKYFLNMQWNLKHDVWEAVKDAAVGVVKAGPHAFGAGEMTEYGKQWLDYNVKRWEAKGRTPEQIASLSKTMESTIRQAEAVYMFSPMIFGVELAAASKVGQAGVKYAATSGVGKLLAGATVPVALPGVIRSEVTRPLEDLTGIPKETVEPWLLGGLMALGVGHTLFVTHGDYIQALRYSKHSAESLVHSMEKTAVWLKAGKVPPPGADDVLDRLRAKAAIAGEEQRKQAEDLALKSNTRERAPDIFERIHAENPNVGPMEITHDAVNHLTDAEKLKLSEAIPDLILQLRNGEYTGMPIRAEVGKWNGHFYPEIEKKLHDHIRLDKDTFTLAEAKAVEAKAQAQAEAVAAGEHPLAVEYQERAKIIQSRSPQPDPGHTRLWSGGDGHYHPDLAEALEIRAALDGKLTYRDVPNNRLPEYQAGVLPPELVPKEVEANHGITYVDAMKTAAGLHNMPVFELAVERGNVPVFENGAIGLPKPLYDRHIRLKNKQIREEQEFDRRQKAREIHAEKKKEWAENETAVRQEVWEDLATDPAWKLSRYFHDGYLDGVKQPDGIPKIGREYLSSAQKASFPNLGRRTVAAGKGGVNPDMIAGELGYKSGAELVDDLIKLEVTMGKGKTREGPQEFFERRVNIETNRRMKQRYGPLDEQVAREVEDHIVGGTPLEMLHERLLAAALSAGHEGLPMSADEMHRIVAHDVHSQPNARVDFDDYLRNSFRNFNAYAEAATKGDWQTALKHAQSQYMDMLYMREAKELEKFRDELIKQKDRYVPNREVKGVPNLFSLHIHNLFEKLGIATKRGKADIDANLIQNAPYDTFKAFYDSRNFDSEGRPFGLPEGMAGDEIPWLANMPVHQPLLDNPAWAKNIKDLTVGELKDIVDTIKAIDHVGRLEESILVRGRAESVERLLGVLTEQMLQHKDTPQLLDRMGRSRVKWTRAARANLTPIEHHFNKIDWDNPSGPFSRYVWTPIAHASNTYHTMAREFAGHFTRIFAPDRKVDLTEQIPNHMLYSPQSMRYDPKTGVFSKPKEGAQLRVITRHNLRTIALNSGTDSSWNKLVRGFGLDPKVDGPKLESWLHQHMTERDWQFVQDTWAMYKEIGKLEDRMMMDIAGITTRKLPGRAIKIQAMGPMFGREIQGEYYPLHYDRDVGFGPTDAPLDRSYNIRAMTPTGHEKERTGYIGPIDLTYDHLVPSINKRIKNIAFRKVILDTGKIFNNEQFRRIHTDKFGKEFTSLLPDFLRDMAGQSGMTGPNMSLLNKAGEWVRVNVVGALIGFNPSTPMKHAPTAYFHSMRETGLGHFLTAKNDLFFADVATRNSNREFIHANSEEVRNRIHMWDETLPGAYDIGVGAPLKWSDVLSRGATMGDFMKYARQASLHAGANVVAKTDLMSAEIVWLAKYRETLENSGYKHLDFNEAHTIAVDMANRSVRRAHGSTHLVDRPALLRGNNPWLRSVTSLYSFFNSTLMRSWRIAWKSRQFINKVGAEDVPRAELGADIAKDILAYWVIPLAIEQMVSPLDFKSDTPLEYGLKFGAFGALHLGAGQIPIVREVVHSMVTGHEPAFGILPSAYKPFIELAKFFQKHPDAYHGGELLEGLIGLSSIAFGVGSFQLGKWAHGAYDLIMDYKPAPSDVEEYYRWLRRGTVVPPRH